MDTDEHVARSVAARVGAGACTDADALFDNSDVDVVAICSPDRFHADQIEAACRAGKRAILCEKPLATTIDEAHRIARASDSSGVPVVVGTMHAFDPAYQAARSAWVDLSATASLVRSVIYLPPNAVMIDLSTELVAPPAPDTRSEESPSAERSAALMRTAVLGLAIHNTPLIRALLPAIDSVRVARFLEPFGYVLTITTESDCAQMIALMGGRWRPDWTFDAWGPACSLHVAFPPAYVLAGSSTAQLRLPDGRLHVWHYPENGYQGEWRYVADAALGVVPPPRAAAAVDELAYALDIANRAERLILETQ
jgi:predicted dehydrogenase